MTEFFPRSEIYGITSQLRRAAVSIPSNIAEGNRRPTSKDFCHFLAIAFASGAELETQLLISKKLNFTGISKYELAESTLAEVMKMLNVLISRIKRKS